MTVRWQWARADGTPNWHLGTETFEPIWENCFDLLRFHRGKGFTVENRSPGGRTHQMRLGEVTNFLEQRLNANDLDSKFIVKSNLDQYALAFRRHDVVDPEVKQLEQFCLSAIGAGYSLGAAGPDAYDCSGYTMAGVRLVTGILLPHKAGATNQPSQLHDSRILHIARSQLKPFDLLFHHGNSQEVDHVTFYGGNDDWAPGYVYDAEPHSTNAPSGWPTPQTGTGIRKRPMNTGWYTDWEHVVAIGRVVAINGTP